MRPPASNFPKLPVSHGQSPSVPWSKSPRWAGLWIPAWNRICQSYLALITLAFWMLLINPQLPPAPGFELSPYASLRILFPQNFNWLNSELIPSPAQPSCYHYPAHFLETTHSWSCLPHASKCKLHRRMKLYPVLYPSSWNTDCRVGADK